MPIILFAAMFFAGEGFGIMQNGIIPTSLIFNETSDWGLGFGEEGSQPTGNESVEKMKEYLIERGLEIEEVDNYVE